MTIDAARLMSTIHDMAQIGGIPNSGVTRLALTDEDRCARELFRDWCTDAGLDVRTDDVGNQIATRAGRSDRAPVLIGSHLDTVPEGGRFDGTLGVLAGLEVVRSLNDDGIETDAPIAIVNWTGEEGSRFAPPLIGSSTALGVRELAQTYATVDLDGVRFEDALHLTDQRGDQANRPTEATAYLELHIEQGPILEERDLAVGVVSGIIGQAWYAVTITGAPGHAGTTPMRTRKDALIAASQLVLGLRANALQPEGYAVTTVGQMIVEPNAMNVIPGVVRLTVDIRCALARDVERLAQGLETLAAGVAENNGVEIRIEGHGGGDPTPFDDSIISTMHAAANDVGIPVVDLWSGAGHDAQIAALRYPAGMIFVRTRDGLSHAEAEFAAPEDIVAATQVLRETAVSLAGG